MLGQPSVMRSSFNCARLEIIWESNTLGECFARRMEVSSPTCRASLQFVSTVHGGTKLSGGCRYGCTTVRMM